MRVGFVGVGGIAGNYRASLRRLAGVAVTAVCDVDPQRAAAVAEEEGATAYLETDAMLAAERLDALFVCLPPFAHTDQVARAAELGLALFVAKPVALDLAIARRAREAIAAAGVINQAGYMWRSGDAVASARRLLAGRAVTLAAGQVLVGLPGTPWWRVAAKSGGQVLEQSTHLLDLMRYLVGEVTAVSATGHRGALGELTDFEDSTVVQMRFAGGAVGSLVSTHTGGLGRYQLTLLGRDVAIDIDCVANRVSSRVDGDAAECQGTENGYFRQIETFVAAYRAGDQSLIVTDYADAVRSLALSLAVNRSLAADGAWLEVEEV